MHPATEPNKAVQCAVVDNDKPAFSLYLLDSKDPVFMHQATNANKAVNCAKPAVSF